MSHIPTSHPSTWTATEELVRELLVALQQIERLADPDAWAKGKPSWVRMETVRHVAGAAIVEAVRQLGAKRAEDKR